MVKEPSTLQAANGYQCHTDRKGPAKRVSVYVVPDGYVLGHRKELLHATEWQDIPCGHITSAGDPECDGCRHRKCK